ncbi:hypothetical protein H6P81_006196 [Aristolochia fimbriata]|uniref:Uncharacterized protein n=1 Tax=Aristolochia fimbriata TaxID=158543 RepID=A0AAV7EWS4_ARIFI|nr:hypothetical protein H6P81_006196 [Aristolochia fimbriata]
MVQVSGVGTLKLDPALLWVPGQAESLGLFSGDEETDPKPLRFRDRPPPWIRPCFFGVVKLPSRLSPFFKERKKKTRQNAAFLRKWERRLEHGSSRIGRIALTGSKMGVTRTDGDQSRIDVGFPTNPTHSRTRCVPYSKVVGQIALHRRRKTRIWGWSGWTMNPDRGAPVKICAHGPDSLLKAWKGGGRKWRAWREVGPAKAVWKGAVVGAHYNCHGHRHESRVTRRGGNRRLHRVESKARRMRRAIRTFRVDCCAATRAFFVFMAVPVAQSLDLTCSLRGKRKRKPPRGGVDEALSSFEVGDSSFLNFKRNA